MNSLPDRSFLCRRFVPVTTVTAIDFYPVSGMFDTPGGLIPLPDRAEADHLI
jgi:hypothetical protein